MSGKTSIEWTDAVWNPVTGCTKVSAGCRNCYAESIAKRFWGDRKFTEVQCHPDRLDEPLHWKKPSLVFVNSMSDLFHKDVPDEFIERIFSTMYNAKQHIFQILTKRPKRMLDFISRSAYLSNNPPPNIWLGVSVEDQNTAEERIPDLLYTPAAVHFVSCEPLLENIDLQLEGRNFRILELNQHIDWVIAGCESGPKRRPANADWLRSLQRQCNRASVPFFLKQMEVDGKVQRMPMLDGMTWLQYPEGK
jgi:protein gp37